jgi:serine/threonine protein kinase
LHHFHIGHLDIKPMNIMYSPSAKELVFIDFGFSGFIEEALGFKSNCNFAGTLNFCGNEMKKAFNAL